MRKGYMENGQHWHWPGLWYCRAADRVGKLRYIDSGFKGGDISFIRCGNIVREKTESIGRTNIMTANSSDIRSMDPQVGGFTICNAEFPYL